MPGKHGLLVELCKIHLKFKTGAEKQRLGEAEEYLQFQNRSENTFKKKKSQLLISAALASSRKDNSARGDQEWPLLTQRVREMMFMNPVRSRFPHLGVELQPAKLRGATPNFRFRTT